MLITTVSDATVSIYRTGKSCFGTLVNIWLDGNGNVNVTNHITRKTATGAWMVAICGNTGDLAPTPPDNVNVALNTPVTQLLTLLTNGETTDGRYGLPPAVTYQPHSNYDMGMGAVLGSSENVSPGFQSPGQNRPMFPGMVAQGYIPRNQPIHVGFVGISTNPETPVVLTTNFQLVAINIPSWARLNWAEQHRPISPEEQVLLDVIKESGL